MTSASAIARAEMKGARWVVKREDEYLANFVGFTDDQRHAYRFESFDSALGWAARNCDGCRVVRLVPRKR